MKERGGEWRGREMSCSVSKIRGANFHEETFGGTEPHLPFFSPAFNVFERILEVLVGVSN